MKFTPPRIVYIKSILSAFFALLAFTIISCQNETSSKDDDSVLSSITINTLPTKTTYEQNETFTPSELKITASYSDKSTKTIAYPATGLSVTQPSTESTGTKTVTVSYTENAVTKSTTFTITVTPPASEKITTTEEIGNELINSTGKDVDTLLMQDKASYFENATRIQ